MTVTDSRRKPSPYPRTEVAPAVTERRSETCNAGSQAAPVERETLAGKPTVLQSAITHGKRVAEGVRRCWKLPPLLTVQPPTIEQLDQYARHAAYTSKTGARRACGIGWCYLVAVPNLVASRMWAALWERPGRILTVLLTVKLLSFTPPVAWAVDNIIVPVARGALWLIL